MHTHIIHIILLVLCYSNMFRPSKGNFQGVRLIHLHSQIGKMCTGCKTQFTEQRVLCYAADDWLID
jgi:hypothetical protein